MNIHPSAIIDSGARLGDDVQIGPGAVIEKNTEIGSGTIIGPHAVIKEFTTLGTACRVHACAIIGDTPQDLAFNNTESFVRIGARTTLREGVIIHRGTKEGSETRVGDDCYIMGNSHLAHNVKLGNKVLLANGALLGGYVDVGDGAFISGNAVVHQFCRVGRLTMIGGLSGISKDVPPFCMTRSVSPNVIVGLNVIGLRRNGFSREQRIAVRECLKILYLQDLNVSQAIEKLKLRSGDAMAAEWVSFIESSTRGICRFSSGGHSENEE